MATWKAYRHQQKENTRICHQSHDSVRAPRPPCRPFCRDAPATPVHAFLPRLPAHVTPPQSRRRLKVRPADGAFSFLMTPRFAAPACLRAPAPRADKFAPRTMMPAIKDG